MYSKKLICVDLIQYSVYILFIVICIGYTNVVYNTKDYTMTNIDTLTNDLLAEAV